jgi:4-diphosphocytidyl-2-C-methyl-D-erythritol kinase
VCLLLLKAYAKLNLTLDICGTREDGYHLLDSIFQSISIHDRIQIEKTDETDIRLLCIPEIYGDNIASRAAELFFLYTGIEAGVSIHIEKSIPLESGLAGGSANAAAVLVGLNTLFDQSLSQRELADIALQLGADVPFFLVGGTCRARGIGEDLEQIQLEHRIHYVILKPAVGMNTTAIYDIYDSDPTQKKRNKRFARVILGRSAAMPTMCSSRPRSL